MTRRCAPAVVHRPEKTNHGWLYSLQDVGPDIPLVDMRDGFTTTLWSFVLPRDRLHPSALACRQVIANSVLAVRP